MHLFMIFVLFLFNTLPELTICLYKHLSVVERSSLDHDTEVVQCFKYLVLTAVHNFASVVLLLLSQKCWLP